MSDKDHVFLGLHIWAAAFSVQNDRSITAVMFLVFCVLWVVGFARRLLA